MPRSCKRCRVIVILVTEVLATEDPYVRYDAEPWWSKQHRYGPPCGGATAMLTRKGQDLLAVGALVVMLAVASSVALLRIGVSQRPVDLTLNPSPLGYTFSLVLFVVPCVVFGVWVGRSPRTAAPRRAGGLTLLLLMPLGLVVINR
jgi:hypothetical protein